MQQKLPVHLWNTWAMFSIWHKTVYVVSQFLEWYLLVYHSHIVRNIFTVDYIVKYIDDDCGFVGLGVALLSETWDKKKCARESCRTWNQEWLHWRGPAEIYSSNSPTSEYKESCTTLRNVRQKKNVLVNHAELETKNDCAGEDQQKFILAIVLLLNTRRVARLSETWDKKKCARESCRTWNQEWLRWRGPAEIYSSNRPTSEDEESCTTLRNVRQKNTLMSRAELGSKNDCAGEGQQKYTV
jgi:hypothetical protein